MQDLSYTRIIIYIDLITIITDDNVTDDLCQVVHYFTFSAQYYELM